MWLLLMALPMQGYAAATMLHCGASSDRQGVAAASSHHDHAAMVASTRAELPGHAAHGGHADVSKAKCSACAACCMGTGLPPAAIGFEPRATAPGPEAVVSVPAVVFCTDGPDRPPRLSPT